MGFLKTMFSRTRPEPASSEAMGISFPPHIMYALLAHADARSIPVDQLITEIVTDVMEDVMVKAAQVNHAYRERKEAGGNLQ